LIEISKRFKEGAPAVDKLALSHSRVTTDIYRIFTADPSDLTVAGTSEPPKRILIEGAPGIGKTVLAKEIVFQWSKGELLEDCKLVFLLYLRDPRVHKIRSIDDLLKMFMVEEVPQELEKYVRGCRGENVAFVFDGFDEYPAALQRNSLITDIIKGEGIGRSLHQSTVVVTSRPTATLFLHCIVDRRIEILGFAKEEREKYILVSLKDSPERKEVLEKYLKQHPIINSLCFIPLHLAILLFLFQMDALPETLTEMNEFFIVHTIYRYMKKTISMDENVVVKKLTELPEDVYIFVCKLARLAFKGLQKNQLVFSYDEIKQFCPQISETINGFGLLQAVQHYAQRGAGRTTSFNFLHFTMQEYLAALRVSTLPNDQQLSLMKETFWDGQFNFMWMMYVGIVGIEHEVIVTFLSTYDEELILQRRERIAIVRRIMKNHNSKPNKSRVDTPETPPSVNVMLPLVDDDTPCLIPLNNLQTNKVTNNLLRITDTPWPSLNHGVDKTHMRSYDTDYLLHTYDYPNQDHLSRDIRRDKRKCLHLFQCYMEAKSDKITETISSIFSGGDIKLNDITLLPHHISSLIFFMSSTTQQWRSLNLQNCNLRRNGMKCLLEHVIKNEEKMSTLQYVDLSGNDSSPWGVYCAIIRHCCVNSLTLCGDDGMEEHVKEITDSLEANRRLESLMLCGVGRIGIDSIKEILVNNSTLSEVNLSWMKIGSEGIKCNKMVQTKIPLSSLNNGKMVSSYNRMVDINILCDEQFYKTTDLSTNDDALALIAFGLYNYITVMKCNITFPEVSDVGATYESSSRLLDLLLSSHQSRYIIKLARSEVSCNVSGKMIRNDEILLLSLMLYNNIDVRKLDISWNNLSDVAVLAISYSLENNTTLQDLSLYNNNITDVGAVAIGKAIHKNFTLKKLNISVNKISANGAVAIFSNATNYLCELFLSHNKITDEGILPIARGIEVCRALRVLDISQNYISKSEMLLFCDSLKSNMSILTLTISLPENNDVIYINAEDSVCNVANKAMGDSGAQIVSALLHNNTNVVKLDISRNQIMEDGIIAIGDCLKNNTMLQEVDMSFNNINVEGAKIIAGVIQANVALQTLDISYCGIPNDGVVVVSESYKNNKTLQQLIISWNNDQVTFNTTNPFCNLSNKAIGNTGALIVSNLLHNSTVVKQLNISYNNISEDGALALSCYLTNTNTLEELDMSGNKINQKAVEVLVHAVKFNSSLKNLRLTF